jgi:hypothetical protein
MDAERVNLMAAVSAAEDASLTEEEDHTALSSSPSGSTTPATGGVHNHNLHAVMSAHHHHHRNGGAVITEIECGDDFDAENAVAGGGGERRYSEYVDYFGKEVEIFYALSGELKTRVYRPSEMARLCSCHPSRVSVFVVV